MEKMNAYRLLVTKPEGKRPLRPRHRCVDNIRINLGDGMEFYGLTGLAEDRERRRALVNAAMNLRVP
jgi:hypothetical protein